MGRLRLTTGLAIANAKDNASVWAIAQGQRADIGALSAVKMSLDRAQSIAEVWMTSGQFQRRRTPACAIRCRPPVARTTGRRRAA